jgi:iron complex transport system ATP-binding protein
MMLTVNDLSFGYKRQDTLKNIHFEIQQGELTVILGPNGVGKTTLLKCLNKILLPKQGDVFVGKKNVRTMNVKEIARQIAYVAQTSEAARMTVFDAILMGRSPHIRYRASKTDLLKVDAVIRHLNLSRLSLKYLNQMSGGELQKVCIARALVQQTDVLLLDEPTASLDLKNQTHILGLIRHIIKDHHMAAVMTMHDLNAAMRYADKYIFLKNCAVYSAGNICDITPQMVEDVYGVKVDIMHHKGLPVVIPREESEGIADKTAVCVADDQAA